MLCGLGAGPRETSRMGDPSRQKDTINVSLFAKVARLLARLSAIQWLPLKQQV